jgi:hypothetical protein
MYKIKRCSAILMAIFISVLGAAAQPPAPSPAPKHDAKIEVVYDEPEDQTRIRLDEMNIFESDSEKLSIIIVGTFDTRTPPKTQTSELLVSFQARSKNRRFQVEPQMIIRADGEVIRTRQMKNYSFQEEKGWVVEPLLTMIPYDVLAKMAGAKTVVIEIGAGKYPLSANNLEALRDLAGRFVR